MKTRTRSSALAAVSSLLALVSACGGGGGTSTPPPPPPPTNRAPTLTTTAASTNEDTATSTQLSATDPDNNPVTFALSTNPQHGTATLTAAGLLNYTPATNYSGPDTVGVTVSDNAGAQAAATVTIAVAAVNDAPRLSTTALSVNEDAVLTALLAGTDVEGDAFTFQLLPGAAHGNVALDVSGALTYTPNANFSGTDQVRVRLIETGSGMALPDQIVSIDVLPLNDPPIANDDTLRVTAAAGQNVAIPALINDVDIDGDAVTPTVVTQPRGGTVTVNATTHQLTFEPANNFTGPIEFSYRVSDGTAVSNIATVRAVIGDFQRVVFLSDYTQPGVPEVHVFDGLEVRRVSDSLTPGAIVSNYALAGDLMTLAYVVEANDADRVYVKPLDGSAAAELRYTSALKSAPAGRHVRVTLNADGTYMSVDDEWLGTPKHLFLVNTATGASTRVGALMPGVVETYDAVFHPLEPRLVMVQGQTAGTLPRDSSNFAATAFTGDAADMRALTQIGANYSAGSYAADYFLYGRDTRYLYFNERPQAGAPLTANLIAYDRTSGARIPLVRFAFTPDRGFSFPGTLSPDLNRLCVWFYDPATLAFNGPSQLYSFDVGNPASVLAAGPLVSGLTTCGFASDNRTMVYRAKPPASNLMRTYSVDSLTPGVSLPLAPAAETSSEQGSATLAPHAMRIAISFFDDDGIDGYTGQAGRFYSLSIDGSGDAFLFSDTYVSESVTSGTFNSNDDGSYVLYARPSGGISALELMSTHGLNLSIPLSRNSETIGVTSARWLQRFP